MIMKMQCVAQWTQITSKYDLTPANLSNQIKLTLKIENENVLESLFGRFFISFFVSRSQEIKI